MSLFVMASLGLSSSTMHVSMSTISRQVTSSHGGPPGSAVRNLPVETILLWLFHSRFICFFSSSVKRSVFLRCSCYSRFLRKLSIGCFMSQ